MYKLLKISGLVLTLVFLHVANAESQSSSSPYSVFGLGSLETNSLGPGRGMGGTSIAFRSSTYLNISNPASFSGLDSLLSIFEIGLFGKYTSYASSTKNQSAIDANFRYVVMGFRITPWLATSFGFAPYSTIGYNINTKSDVEGSNLKYNKVFSGDGGVNRTFLSTSFKVNKNLALGVNASWLFGDITHRELSETYYYSLENVTNLSNFHLNYGLNYRFAINENNFSIGLIFGDSKKLNAKNTTTIKTNTETEVIKGRSSKYNIPRNYGIGLAYERGFFRAGIDFERSMWEGTEFNNTGIRSRNCDRISAGVEFPSLGPNKGTGRMLLYRVGAEYRESYFIINNTPVNYYAFSFGTGIPLKGVLSTVNVSVELGQNGVNKNDLFRENFVTLHLDFSLRDLWFIKRRYL